MKKIISILTLTIILSYLLPNIALGISPTSLIQLDGTEQINTNLEIHDGEEWSQWEPQLVYYIISGKTHYAYNVIDEINSQEEIGYHNINSNWRLTDEMKWRVIINGFPYKTARQLGVCTDEEAYLVTKAALYCITMEKDSTIFRVPGKEEDKIITAIQNLIDTALESRQTQEDGMIEIEKDVNYELKDNYYIQTYTVSSNVEIDSIEITNMLRIPEESKVVYIDGNKPNEKQFKVMIPKSNITKEMNGIIFVKVKCNTYPIYYRKK